MPITPKENVKYFYVLVKIFSIPCSQLLWVNGVFVCVFAHSHTGLPLPGNSMFSILRDNSGTHEFTSTN